MNWATLLLAIQQMSPIEAILLTIMVIFFIYRGGINYFIPFITKKRKGTKSLMSMHVGCRNYTSLEVILEKVMEKSDKIVRIKYQETLYEQMNEAELMWGDIKDILKDNFSRAFNEQNSRASKENKLFSSRCYSIILDSLETEMMGLVRRWMKKNHFITKTELEFADYIEDRTKRLHDKMTRLFDEKYDEDKLLVKRELKRKMIDSSMPIISKRISTFFLRARAIAVEKENQIKNIEEEISKI